MDTATINRRGYEPIKPILTGIDGISDVASLMKFAAIELRSGNRSIIGFGVSPDNKNSGINIAHAYQAGIGLPDRDYYFRTDSSTVGIQLAYKKYISALFQLTGSDRLPAHSRRKLLMASKSKLLQRIKQILSLGMSMPITIK